MTRFLFPLRFRNRWLAVTSAAEAWNGDASSLIERLRSGVPLSAEEREFLAVVLEKGRAPRRRGRRPDAGVAARERQAADLVVAKVTAGQGVTDAVGDVEADLDLSRGQIWNALNEYYPAWDRLPEFEP